MDAKEAKKIADEYNNEANRKKREKEFVEENLPYVLDVIKSYASIGDLSLTDYMFEHKFLGKPENEVRCLVKALQAKGYEVNYSTYGESWQMSISWEC